MSVLRREGPIETATAECRFRLPDIEEILTISHVPVRLLVALTEASQNRALLT